MTHSTFVSSKRFMFFFLSLCLILLCKTAFAEKKDLLHLSEAASPPLSTNCGPPYSVPIEKSTEGELIDCRKGKWCWGVSNNQCVAGYYYRECCCKYKCSNKKLERKPCSGNGGWELIESKMVVPCSNSCSGKNSDGTSWFNNCSVGNCTYGCIQGTCNKVTCNVGCAPSPPRSAQDQGQSVR